MISRLNEIFVDVEFRSNLRVRFFDKYRKRMSFPEFRKNVSSNLFVTVITTSFLLGLLVFSF